MHLMVPYPSFSSLSGFFHLLSLNIVVYSKPGEDLDQNLEVKGKSHCISSNILLFYLQNADQPPANQCHLEHTGGNSIKLVTPTPWALNQQIALLK